MLDADPPDPHDSFDPSLELVVILETNNPFQLAMVQGLLDEAQIPHFVLGEIATLVRDVDGFLHKWVRLQVPRDREREARERLAQIEAVPEEPGDAEA